MADMGAEDEEVLTDARLLTPTDADGPSDSRPPLPPQRGRRASPMPAGHVNEVHFAFLDGAPDTPNTLLRGSPPASGGREPSQRSRWQEPGDGAFGPLQHLAGAGAPSSVPNILRVCLFFVLLGIIPSMMIFLIDISVHSLFAARERLAEMRQLVDFLLYVGSGAFLCMLATAACHLWSKEAEGSGIPAMKAIMSGFYDRMKPALSLWTLLAKGIGLVCAIGGGLPVGWEGPNVHISCIVAHHLSRLPLFRIMRRDRALRMQIMACACAVGLASSFGTPIGGVLYALETTSSFYLVATFWKCTLATLSGALVYDVLYKTPLVEAFANTSFAQGDYTRMQIIFFAIMGALLGVLGAFFVRCVHYVYLLRKRKVLGTRRYLMLFIVGVVAAVIQYPLDLFRLDPRHAINVLFSSHNLRELSPMDVGLLVLIKFPLIVVSIGLPIPAGVFIPCFLLGAGLGRLYGELLRVIFGDVIVPGGYAVVGAAAFTAGVTRALSTAVVIFEVTGQLKHMMPMLCAVLASVIVANGINRSLYDTLIIMKELPYMPHMRRDRAPTQRVYQVMRTEVVALAQFIKAEEVRTALEQNPHFESFPIVSNGGGYLLGSLRRKTLVNMVEQRRMRFTDVKVDGTNGKSNGNGHLTEDELLDSHSAPSIRDVNAMSMSMDGGPFAAGPTDEMLLIDTSVDVVDDAITNTVPVVTGIDTNGSTKPRVVVRRAGGSSNDDELEMHLVPDLSPLVVTNNTTLSQLHFMFVMLMPSHAFVINRGVLEGIITREDLVQSGELWKLKRAEVGESSQGS